MAPKSSTVPSKSVSYLFNHMQYSWIFSDLQKDLVLSLLVTRRTLGRSGEGHCLMTTFTETNSLGDRRM